MKKGLILMVNEFPVIHTNIWDAFWAVPVILILIIIIRFFWRLPSSWFSTVSTVLGLVLSIFISHPDDLPAGIFMGLFYSGAAIGFIYSIEKSFTAYRKK